MLKTGKYKTEIKSSLEGLHGSCKLAEKRTANLKIDQYRLHDLKNREEKKKYQEKKRTQNLKEYGTSRIQVNVYNGWERLSF